MEPCISTYRILIILSQFVTIIFFTKIRFLLLEPYCLGLKSTFSLVVHIPHGIDTSAIYNYRVQFERNHTADVLILIIGSPNL